MQRFKSSGPVQDFLSANAIVHGQSRPQRCLLGAPPRHRRARAPRVSDLATGDVCPAGAIRPARQHHQPPLVPQAVNLAMPPDRFGEQLNRPQIPAASSPHNSDVESQGMAAITTSPTVSAARYFQTGPIATSGLTRPIAHAE
jgi:hypothetical protein